MSDAKTCCECGRQIAADEQCQRGVPRGSIVPRYRCMSCHQLAEAMPHLVPFGKLVDWINDFLEHDPEDYSCYAPGGCRDVQARCRRWLETIC